METLQYPDALLEKLKETWRPPFFRPGTGSRQDVVVPPSACTPLVDELIQSVVREAFFASLQSEEGDHLQQSLVLAPECAHLAAVDPPWECHQFTRPLAFEAARIAKLAPVLAGGERFILVEYKTGVAQIVGIGRPFDRNPLFAQDHYPRVRAVGPGDIVFYRGASAEFRYRGGVISLLHPEFFTDSGEPRVAMKAIARLLFSHNQLDSDDVIVGVVGYYLADVVKEMMAIGRGGMLAILAPGENPPAALTTACDYPLVPVNAGTLVVEVIEGGLVMDDIEERTLGPDFEPTRLLTEDESESKSGWQDAKGRWASLKVAIGAMAAVDGAVLMTADLHVHGFGCKLPGFDKPASTVLRASGQGEPPVRYDLTKRGTRHSAAASFVDKQHGRLAFIVSADGACGCFMWSEQHGAVMYWPVHVGTFEAARG